MGQRINLKVISNLYSDPDESGNDRLIKKGIKTLINVDIDNLEYPTQIFNARGRVLKNQCKINLRDVGPLTVNHSFEYIKKLKDSRKRITVKGFRR